MTPEALRQRLADLVPCVCISAYTQRGLIQPDCQHHEAMEFFDDVLTPLLPAAGEALVLGPEGWEKRRLVQIGFRTEGYLRVEGAFPLAPEEMKP